MDADTNTYDEAAPNIRLKDSLDIQKLQLGEGQEFEIDEDDDEPDGKVSFILAFSVVLFIENIPDFEADTYTRMHMALL